MRICRRIYINVHTSYIEHFILPKCYTIFLMNGTKAVNQCNNNELYKNHPYDYTWPTAPNWYKGS